MPQLGADFSSDYGFFDAAIAEFVKMFGTGPMAPDPVLRELSRISGMPPGTIRVAPNVPLPLSSTYTSPTELWSKMSGYVDPRLGAIIDARALNPETAWPRSAPAMNAVEQFVKRAPRVGLVIGGGKFAIPGPVADQLGIPLRDVVSGPSIGSLPTSIITPNTTESQLMGSIMATRGPRGGYEGETLDAVVNRAITRLYQAKGAPPPPFRTGTPSSLRKGVLIGASSALGKGVSPATWLRAGNLLPILLLAASVIPLVSQMFGGGRKEEAPA